MLCVEKMSESAFKSRKKLFWLRSDIFYRVFFIETEATEKGFPDALCFTKSGEACLYEFKVTRLDDGVIEFERNQPLWYRMNKGLPINIIAYDTSTGLQHCFPAESLFVKSGEYSLSLGSLKLKLPQHHTNYTKDGVE